MHQLTALYFINLFTKLCPISFPKEYSSFLKFLNKFFHRGMNGRTETVVELLWLRKNASNT